MGKKTSYPCIRPFIGVITPFSTSRCLLCTSWCWWSNHLEHMFMKLDHLPPARGFNNIWNQDLDYWGDGLHIEFRLNQLKLSIYWFKFPGNLKSETDNSPGSIWCSKIWLFPFPWSFTTGTMMPTRAQKIGLHAYNIIYTSNIYIQHTMWSGSMMSIGILKQKSGQVLPKLLEWHTRNLFPASLLSRGSAHTKIHLPCCSYIQFYMWYFILLRGLPSLRYTSNIYISTDINISIYIYIYTP